MPTAAVSQALNALLPSIPASGKWFPASLISQSESLLALSRQRHPRLKSEEEIARAHVCTEITCDRLRVALRLPAIKSGAGAPCKPSVYKKLYKFLDASLADAATGSLTPKGTKRSAAGTPKTGGSIQRTPIQRSESETPTKRRTVDRTPVGGFKGTIKTLASNGSKNNASEDGRAPAFVMPLIRLICKHMNTTSMAPHVYTGSCIVLGLTGLWPPKDEGKSNSAAAAAEAEEAKSKKQITTLIIALYLMVLTRMRKGKMTPPIYAQVSTKSLELAGLDQDDLIQTEEWIGKLNAEGWCNGQDWWDSVPENVIVFGQKKPNDGGGGGGGGGGVGLDVTTEGDDAEDLEVTREQDEQLHWTTTTLRREDLEQDDPEGVLLPGLGTMLHAGNDWMSEDRRAEYQAWSSDIMKKMAAMDRAETKRGKAVAVS